MYLKNIFVWSPVLLAGSVLCAVGDYICPGTADKPPFTIKRDWTIDAVYTGGTTTGKSGFPHDFHGGSGQGNTQLKFFGANPRCNEPNPVLLEFPVMKDGSTYNKDEKRGDGTKTPARVVYYSASGLPILCGVMTHVTENPDGTGSGPFRVCDPAP